MHGPQIHGSGAGIQQGFLLLADNAKGNTWPWHPGSGRTSFWPFFQRSIYLTRGSLHFTLLRGPYFSYGNPPNALFGWTVCKWKSRSIARPFVVHLNVDGCRVITRRPRPHNSTENVTRALGEGGNLLCLRRRQIDALGRRYLNTDISSHPQTAVICYTPNQVLDAGKALARTPQYLVNPLQSPPIDLSGTLVAAESTIPRRAGRFIPLCDLEALERKGWGRSSLVELCSGYA